MSLFTSGATYEYGIRRKLARGLLRWERSLGTDKQLREPSVYDLVTRDEFENISHRLLTRTYDKHTAAIWTRALKRRGEAFYFGATAKQEALSQYGDWTSGKLADERELAARARTSSDVGFVIAPTIIP